MVPSAGVANQARVEKVFPVPNEGFSTTKARLLGAVLSTVKLAPSVIPVEPELLDRHGAGQHCVLRHQVPDHRSERSPDHSGADPRSDRGLHCGRGYGR